MSFKSLFFGSLFVVGSVAAQTPSLPSPQQMDAARAARDAAMQFQGGNRAEQANPGLTPLGVLPPVSLPNPVSNLTPEQLREMQRSALPQAKPGDFKPPVATPPAQLMIFVSMSMPENMLKQYAAQAKRFDGVLMLRGFVSNKLSETQKNLARLNDTGATWEINPEPFNYFGVDKVPAIVLASPGYTQSAAGERAKPETFAVIYGDLSVDAALDKFSLGAKDDLAALAKARIAAGRKR